MTYAPRVRLGLKIAAGLALAYCGWVFTDRYMTNSRWVRQVARSQAAARNPEFDRIYGGSSVKILSFYARDGDLLEGDRTVLCYGVLNARAVRIAPWVGEVTPSLSRCIPVAPEQDTRFTITAEGKDGRTVSETFVLPVKPDYDSFPKVTAFRVVGHSLGHGGVHVYSLYFATRNAEEVSSDPPVLPTLHGAPYSYFYVAPRQTTTYTLKVLGKKGRTAEKQLTVNVP